MKKIFDGLRDRNTGVEYSVNLELTADKQIEAEEYDPNLDYDADKFYADTPEALAEIRADSKKVLAKIADMNASFGVLGLQVPVLECLG